MASDKPDSPRSVAFIEAEKKNPGLIDGDNASHIWSFFEGWKMAMDWVRAHGRPEKGIYD